MTDALPAELRRITPAMGLEPTTLCLDNRQLPALENSIPQANFSLGVFRATQKLRPRISARGIEPDLANYMLDNQNHPACEKNYGEQSISERVAIER